ncbi:MAG: hypothetical protein LQ340_002560 [Diploschistes diacapsis]|nr:MAG: hypothetical protein LQ340_002560 [Diploschistes diacapsis]
MLRYDEKEEDEVESARGSHVRGMGLNTRTLHDRTRSAPTLPVPSERNPYLQPKRPQLASAEQSQPIANHVRASSLSSDSKPVMTSPRNGEQGDPASQRGQDKDIYAYFKGSVIVSMLIRNWPG